MTATLDELEAAGMCDCGLPLEGHPEVPNPKPLRSWHSERHLQGKDGQGRRKPKPHQAFTITSKAIRAANEPYRCTGPRGPSDRLLQVASTVRENQGNQAAAARELGISSAAVKVMMKRARKDYGIGDI